jgi:anti-sigma factor RsiW
MSHHERQPTCSSVHESIELYVDGALPAEQTRAIENHVAHCARCKRELVVANRVVNELRNMSALDCPDDVTERVVGALDPSSSRHAGFLPRWFKRYKPLHRALAGGLAAILAIVAAVFLYPGPNRDERPTAEEVAQAEVAIKWTFGYVNQISRRSGLAVRDEVFEAGVVDPVQRAVRAAVSIGTKTPEKEDGGSL